jgi:nucleoside-diphosphate-sugar epimerase
MRIAILGATSQIAKDLIVSFATSHDYALHLFARRPDEVSAWLNASGLSERYPSSPYVEFPSQQFDAVINFVGVGNPAHTAAMGNAIFEITRQYDQLALDYLQAHSSCRYIFLSSGAAYGSGFADPANRNTPAVIAINNLAAHEWYGVAKLYAECRHRALSNLSIFDIRVFNYFSHTQDISARFLITDILRAIRDQMVLQTSADYIVRDFIHPNDFYQLVVTLLSAPAANAAVDAYSRAPVDKPSFLAAMQQCFGLQYEIIASPTGLNATGGKPHYYSLNTRAADFGYQPSLTALESVLQESEKIIQRGFA